MSEIIKNKLFLGDAFDANNVDFLNQNNITTIICVSSDVNIKNVNQNNVYYYKLTDDYECNISEYFNEITHLIHNKKVVLINCMAGISRSTTFVLVYLMRHYKCNLKQAFEYVKSKRNRICPNKKFMEYLIEEENKILGYNSLTYKEYIKLFFYT